VGTHKPVIKQVYELYVLFKAFILSLSIIVICLSIKLNSKLIFLRQFSINETTLLYLFLRPDNIIFN